MKQQLLRAQNICRKLTQALPEHNFDAITAFGEGKVVPGLVHQVRRLERDKAALLAERSLSIDLYWDVIWLERFVGDQLDDCLGALRAMIQSTQRNTLEALA